MMRARVTFSGWTGGPGLSTFYFLSPLEDTAAATAILARVQAYLTSVRTLIPPAVTMNASGLVDCLDAETGQVTNTIAIADPAGIAGTANPTDFAPLSVAANGSLLTSTFIAGRRVRGRTYISPLGSTSFNSTGFITTAKAGDVVTALGILKGTGSPAQELVVWHRPKSGAGGSMAPVTAVACPQKPATLKSRRD